MGLSPRPTTRAPHSLLLGGAARKGIPETPSRSTRRSGFLNVCDRSTPTRGLHDREGLRAPVHEREDVVFEPLHYLALLERKPRALDQAAPLTGWELPECFPRLRRLLEARAHK